MANVVWLIESIIAHYQIKLKASLKIEVFQKSFSMTLRAGLSKKKLLNH